MAYGRRRSSYRRKGRRSNGSLSSRNVYLNKGARAQAKQIMALKRKINRVYRATRPEVKIAYTIPEQHRWSDYQYVVSQEGYVSPDFSLPVEQARLYDLGLPDLGTGDDEMVGNTVNLLPPTVYMNFNMNQVLDMRIANNVVAQNFNEWTRASVRCVFFMSKTVMEHFPIIDNIVNVSNATANPGGTSGLYGPMYELNTVNPLADEISSRYKVLKDIRFQLTYDKPVKNLKVKLPVGKIRKFVKSAQEADFSKGAIYCVVIVSGNKTQSLQSGSQQVYFVPVVNSTFYAKLPYTDP